MSYRSPSSDRGRISIMFAIAVTAIISIIGLTVDAGGKMHAKQRADNVAAEAARAGGQLINTTQAFLGGPKILDRTKALAAAQKYLDDAKVGGRPVVVDDTHIRVDVTIVYHTVILSAFNINEFTVTGTATATLVLT